MRRPTQGSMARSTQGRPGFEASWWLSALACAALWLGWSGTATASPRLVLVDGAERAQLHEALRISLQPWSFEVVDWPRPKAGAALDEAAMARKANARYVVWHDQASKQLVVYDAELARRERRPIAELPRDEADAGALALSIKMMLRLQPPSEPPASSAAADEELRLLPSFGLGPRFGLDGDSSTQLRAQLGLMVAPPRLHGLRFGLLGEVGTSTDVSGGGFVGEWSEWSLLAAIGKELPVTTWMLNAQVAAGLSRATFSGAEAKTARKESHSELCGAASFGATRGFGPVTAGLTMQVVARGSESYARSGNGKALWAEPALSLQLLAVVELSL
jgi:hypothetical protein